MTELRRGDKPTRGIRTGRGAGLSGLLRENLLALAGWLCLIAASLIAFRLTEGTQYHHLAVGIMMSSSSLFILMTLFECLWRLFADDSSKG